MAERVTNRPKASPADHLVLDAVSWQSYEKFLEAVGDRAVRLTYDRGTLEITALSWNHEWWKARVRILIAAVGDELNIDLCEAGSTTLKRRDVASGLEPDEAFYIQHWQAVMGIKELDLTRTPPPDLALEVDVTSSSLDRMHIYAAIGVREIWRYDGRDVRFYDLRAQAYEPIERSVQLPMLTVPLVEEFLGNCPAGSDMQIRRYARGWVNERIRPLWTAGSKVKKRRSGKKPPNV